MLEELSVMFSVFDVIAMATCNHFMYSALRLFLISNMISFQQA